MPIVVTNCTNRKRGIITPLLSASSLNRASISKVAAQWINRLRVAPAVKHARDVYCGRSFREAEASALDLGASLYIVSAGLGIVDSNRRVPVYDLTTAPGTGNTILNRIVGARTPQSWWSLISHRTPFGLCLMDMLAKHPTDLILIALSRPYVELIHEELVQITPGQSTRLRFFGKNLEKALPHTLANNWMPYDDRLDSAGHGYSGTQADFAQRALRHFVKEILLRSAKNTCAANHRTLVLSSIANLEIRKAPRRNKLDDNGVGAAIRDNWVRGKGQSSELLRILRRELDIACEQNRFRTIYYTVKKTMGAEK